MKKFFAIGLALAALGATGIAPALAQSSQDQTTHRVYNYVPQDEGSAYPAYVPNSGGDTGATMQDY